MNYVELYEKMKKCGIISGNWKQLLKLLQAEIEAEPNKDYYLKLLTVYFSLIEDGNVYMSLDESVLADKIKLKINQQKIQYEEDGADAAADLECIYDELGQSLPYLSGIETLSIVGSKRLFVVDKGRLFTRKYYDAIQEIIDSTGRLFIDNPQKLGTFDYRTVAKEGFILSKGQKDIVEHGIYNNLLVTGGPGTGKTTSIFFLLLALLKENENYQVYLTAPSGKAADRMKESIQKQYGNVDTTNIAAYVDVIERVKTLNSYTIHRLLGYPSETNGFKYNKGNQFDKNSIFVIDEASMIDVCLFASLLSAIPDGARVFILGDKNQLPSVECGAVFAELLQSLNKNNIVELTESKRFSSDSEIYALADAINTGIDLPIEENDWKKYELFEIKTDTGARKNPIFYYEDAVDHDKDMIDLISLKWYDHYYSELKDKCTAISEDTDIFEQIFNIADNSRILCANNDGIRGIKHINNVILKERFDISNRVSGVYPGELIMITKNDYANGLYNGDCGVIVKFDNDNNLYAVFNKSIKANITDGKQENRLFKIGDFVFYPMRLIDSEEIIPAFAITIHKSQGSDYGNILVILPKLKGHPLLNRQIVYTAVTRTRGNTYILSNQGNMECARSTVVKRDTGIY